MTKTDKILNLLYISSLLSAGIIYLIFEIFFPDMFGCLFSESDRTLRTICETLCIILTLPCVYGALKLFVTKFVKSRIETEKDYMKWAIVRCAMVCVPLLRCELTYYLFCSSNVVAFVGICCIAFLFVWPTSARREREMNKMVVE